MGNLDPITNHTYRSIVSFTLSLLLSPNHPTRGGGTGPVRRRAGQIRLLIFLGFTVTPRGATWKGMGPWLLTSLELLNSSALDKREDNPGRVTISFHWHDKGFLRYQGAPSCLPSCPGGVLALAASQDQLYHSVPRQFSYGLCLPILGRGMCLPHQITYEKQQLALRIFWDAVAHTQCAPNTLCPSPVLCLGDQKKSPLFPSYPNYSSSSQPLLHLFPASSCFCLLLYLSVSSQATSLILPRVSTDGSFPVWGHPLLHPRLDQLIHKSQRCGSVMGSFIQPTQHNTFFFSLMS